MKKSKRILAVTLVSIMIASMGMNVLAEEINTTNETVESSEEQNTLEAEEQSSENEVFEKETEEKTEAEVETETVVEDMQDVVEQSNEEISARGIVQVSDNYTIDTAKNIGRWNTTTTVSGSIEEDQQSAFIKFTVSPGDRLYIRESYDKKFQGMEISLYNTNQVRIGRGINVMDESSVIPFIFVNCNGGTASETFYVSVDRPANSTGTLRYSISFHERIKKGNIRLNFAGKATKAKNATTSSTLTLDTTRDTSIPAQAVVTSLSTSANMYPGLGGVSQTLTNNGIPYVSNSTYEGSGSWTTLTAEQQIPARARWGFNFSTSATAASTMSNVVMTMNYQYDITTTFSN